jgi:ATP-dependent Lon protease
MQTKTEKYVEGVLPVLPVKDTVVFPNMVVPILIKTNKYLPMVEEAGAKDKILFVVSSAGELPGVGTVCRISKFSKEEDGNVLVVQGLSRGSVVEIVSRDPFYRVQVKGIEDMGVIGPEVDKLKATLMKQFTELVQISPNIPDEVLRLCRKVEDPSTLTDMVAAYSNISMERKQEILETLDVEKRLESMIGLINHQLQLASMGRQIQTQVQKGIDKSQREYLLREQLKAIQKELGIDEEGPPEIQELHQRMEEKKLPEPALKVVSKEISKLSKMNPASSEYSVSMNYLDLLLDLPWSESTRDSIDIRKAERILNKHHYDLEKVKKRILEYLAVRKLNPAHKGPILCFSGPPGTGKTSLGRSIAEAMGRNFVRISLGGVRDEAEVRGHRRTYVGALPGRIIQGIKRAGSNNPVFMLDEIDKIGKDFRGDPSSALLEVLDPEQNYSFSDHYLEVEFDLSRIMFITTANQLDTIPRPLLDRMEVLELPGYTEYEKLHIAEKFLIPRQVKEHGLTNRRVTIKPGTIEKIIRLGIQEDFFKDRDLHIHVPAGAIPKDGPSAGVTILSALASLLTCRPIKSDVAMTGEVTLRGAVLPVGGIKEKVLAANRSGIKRIILPERNKNDLEEIPQEIRETMTFHLVKKMEEVLEIALDVPVGPSCN